MSNFWLQKIVLLRVMEVGKIILKKKRPLLLARSVDISKSSYLFHGYPGGMVIETNHAQTMN